jgi:hypothetical protein
MPAIATTAIVSGDFDEQILSDMLILRSNRTARDVTVIKQSEDALRRQAEISQLSFDAIIVWRPDDGIESWNHLQELEQLDVAEAAVGQDRHGDALGQQRLQAGQA